MTVNKSPFTNELTNLNITALRNMEGLSLVFGNSSTSTTQNSPQSKIDFSGSMAYAQKLSYDDFKAVARIPDGTNKYITASTYPGFFRGDDSYAIQNNKSWFASRDGWLYLILGNSKLNWREAHYPTQNFMNGLPTPQEEIQTTANGWEVITVASLWDGIDSVSKKWMSVRNIDNEYEEFIEKSSSTKINQASSICGAGDEQRTGTCCLYYKTPSYDSVAGVTYAIGDFYQCSCTKCYKCIEQAKLLDKHYVFNKFTGGIGLTAGTGEKCSDCDGENYPNDCGPCVCSIDIADKSDAILSEFDLPTRGTPKQNAKFAKAWKNNLKGKIYVSLTPEFETLSTEQRKISSAYRGVEKKLTLNGNCTTPAHIILATEGNKENEEYIVGLTVLDYGSGYDVAPKIDFNALQLICPNAKEEHFRITYLPDMHKNIGDLVGGIQTMIKTEVLLKNITDATHITSFTNYGIVLLKGEDDAPFWQNTNSISATTGLTIKNKYTNVSFTTSDVDNKVKESFDFNGKYGTVANARTDLEDNKLILEIFRANSSDTFNKDFTDGAGKVWIFSSGETPSVSTSGSKLAPEKTDVLHINKFKLNIPEADKIREDISSTTFSIEIIFAGGENLIGD
jgi:hypothetical protein